MSLVRSAGLYGWNLDERSRHRPGGQHPGGDRGELTMVTVEEIREFALTLPRAYEAVVRGRVKFRVGQIVFVAFSHDETVMGFAFPKEERDALIETWPEKFSLPRPSDLRFNWVCVRLDRIDVEEARELVLDAWLMVVPKRVARNYLATAGSTTSA